jgi:hypothetical protein
MINSLENEIETVKNNWKKEVTTLKQKIDELI